METPLFTLYRAKNVTIANVRVIFAIVAPSAVILARKLRNGLPKGPPRGGGGGRGRGGRGRGSGGRGRGSSRGSGGGYGGYGGSQRGRGRGGLFRGHDQRLVGAIAEALDHALSLPAEPQGGEATTEDAGQEGGQPQQGGQMLQGN